MEYKLTKNKVISSFLWKLLERGGVHGVQFIIMVLLARLLSPEDFGIIVLVTVFVAIANLIAQNGLSTALVQKKTIDQIDCSSVFFFNLSVSTTLYILLYFIAPIIASFFEESQLTNLIRILSLTLFIGTLNSVQNAIIARNMEFKKLFFSSLCASIIAGLIGISMAISKFGIWSLVAHQISNQLLVTLILLFAVQWRPEFIFSWNRVKSLYSYGWKLMVSSLIDALYSNIRNIIIGKMFSPSILAFYNRGEQFPSLIINNINGSIQSVLLPALSAYQDNQFKVKMMVRRSIITSSFIIFPMMVGLAVIADPLVRVLLSEKWLPSVPFLQIFCAVYALWPIHTANLQAINALGRSDIFFKLEILKKLIGFGILAISIPFGVYAITLGALLTGIISLFINTYPNLKLLNYSFREQCKDVFPPFLISILMGVIIYPIHYIGLPAIITLVFQMTLGVILYVLLANLFKMESFSYLLNSFKEMLQRKKETTLMVTNEVKR